MLCDICKQNEATIKIKKIVDGNITELVLCLNCARKHAFNAANFDVSFFIGQLINLFDTEMKSINLDSKCEICNTSFSEFIKSGKLGCDNCYKQFEEFIEPLVKKINSNYTGYLKDNSNSEEYDNTLFNNDAVNEEKNILNNLNMKLKDAIECENYELASELRDQIKELNDKKRGI